MRRWTALAGTGLAIILAPTLVAQQVEHPEHPQEADDTLEVGDKAPKLEIEHWFKGDEVTEFEEGKVYLLEFWATW
jgi:hypothetical protein